MHQLTVVLIKDAVEEVVVEVHTVLDSVTRGQIQYVRFLMPTRAR